MSARDIWKMLHLLNNTSRSELSTQELFDAGVDCYQDTLVTIMDRGGVEKEERGGSDVWFLSKGARAVLNSCTVARRLGDNATEVQVDRARVFCMMPFSETWSDLVWRSCVEVAAAGAGLTVYRGDTTLRTGNLIQNVWNQILESGCVVADLSSPNPNVYYELGMAHALGRDTFVIVQKGVDLPADVKGAHYLEYELGDLPRAAKGLKAQLEGWKGDPDIKVAGVEALFP
jgi:hypothetical protein